MKKKIVMFVLAILLLLGLLIVVRYGDKFGIPMLTSVSERGETTQHPETSEPTPELTETTVLTEMPEPTETPVLTEMPEPTASPVPTKMPEPTATPVPTEMPEPTTSPVPTQAPMPAVTTGRKVAIDPGHQKKGNYEKEPVGPGATELKTKVSSGTQGKTTKVPEYEFTLELSLKLKEALEADGYEVILTRDTHEVNISNIERAEVANNAEADIFIRIHADGSDNASAHGISVLYPSEQNPYIPELSKASKRLAQSVLNGLCTATGAKNRGIIKRDDLSGTNWAKMPVILVEAGFMTNAEEEKKLLDTDYQALLIQGMVEGIREYYDEQGE